MVGNQRLKLCCPDILLERLLEVEKCVKLLGVRDEFAKTRPNMAIVFGRLIVVAESAEVDPKIDVEGRTPLTSLKVENANAVAAFLPPRRSGFPEAALLKHGS